MSAFNGDETMKVTLNMRTYKTVCVLAAFFIVGLNQMMTGATFVHLERLFHTDTQGLAMAYTAENLAGLVGSLLPGIYFDRYDSEFQFSVCYFLMALLTMVMTWMPNLTLFTLAIFIRGIAIRYVSTSTKPYLLKLWHGDRYKDAVFQLMDVCWSVGGFIGPLMALPFIRQTTTKFENVDEVPIYNVTRVRYPYMIIGIFCFVIANMFYRLKYTSVKTRKSSELEIEQSIPLKNSDSNAKLNISPLTASRNILLTLTFIYTIFIVWQGNLSTFVSVFVVKGLGWAVGTGAFMVSVFRGSQGVARLIGVALSLWISPTKMLIINMIFGIVAYSTMYYAGNVYQSESLMGLSIILAGFAVSTCFPTTMLWAAQYVEVKASFGSLFGAAACIGSMTNNALTGYLIQNYSPMFLVYILQFACAMCILVFTIMNAFVRLVKFKEQRPRET